MLTITGFDDVVRNVYRMSNDDAKPPATLGELRQAYLGFLSSSRFEAPVNLTHDLVVTDPEKQRLLAAAFSSGALNDLDQANIIGSTFDEDDLQQKGRAVKQAVAELRSLSPALDGAFSLTIHTLMIKGTNRLANGTAAHGGSSSNAIGTIWLSVDDSLTQADLVELLLHELTHHLVFIDEYNRNHFNYDLIASPENFALSAIRGTMRPLDKVVHSIIVAAELASARERLFQHDESQVAVHPDTETILKDTIASCESVLQLRNLTELLSDRTIELVTACLEHCQSQLGRRAAVSV